MPEHLCGFVKKNYANDSYGTCNFDFMINNWRSSTTNVPIKLTSSLRQIEVHQTFGRITRLSYIPESDRITDLNDLIPDTRK
jgi:hypothetical protein